VFEPRTDGARSQDLLSGGWIMHCEVRALDDIRAPAGNDAEHERRFAPGNPAYT
jgi:hypothetical protein